LVEWKVSEEYLLQNNSNTSDNSQLFKQAHLFFSGEKAIIHLVFRLPTGEEQERLVQDPTVASLLCAIYQLTNKSDKNCKLVFVLFVCFFVCFAH
jgi:hypothetical protein